MCCGEWISLLRLPLSGCDFAGELLLLGERLLVQVQMQVLVVMLPPQVLLRCYSVKVLWQQGTLI